MAGSKMNALRLREDATSTSGEPVTLGMIPGVYVPGEAVLLEDIGMDEATAKTLIDDYNLPLELVSATRRTAVDVEVGSGRALSERPGAAIERQAEAVEGEGVVDAYRTLPSPIPPERVPGSGVFGQTPGEETPELSAAEEREQAANAARVTPIPPEVLSEVAKHPEQYPGGPRAAADVGEQSPAGEPDTSGGETE